MFGGGILKQYSSSFTLLARLADAVVSVLVGVVAYSWYLTIWPMGSQYTTLMVLAALLVMLIFPLFGLYQSWRGRGVFHEVRQCTLAWGSVVISLIIITFLTKTSAEYSRVWVFCLPSLLLLFSSLPFTGNLRY